MFGVSFSEHRTSASCWASATITHPSVEMGDNYPRFYHRFTSHQEVAQLNYGGGS